MSLDVLNTYRFAFVYVESGKLRSKEKTVSAATVNNAIDKIKRVYGNVKVMRVERMT